MELLSNMFFRKKCFSLYSCKWLVPCIIFVYVFISMASNINKGFDITDESLYILSAHHPADQTASVSKAGYYTNILYQVTNGDIGQFRMLGLLILLLLSAYFAITLMKSFNPDESVKNQLSQVLIITLSSLTYYNIWLVTPSYNWLALISCLLVSIGIFRSANNSTAHRNHQWILSSFMIGLGGTLAFFAKPTTALGLIFVYFFSFFIFQSKKVFFQIGIASLLFTLVFFILHITAFEAGYWQFLSSIQDGLNLIHILEGGHSTGEILSGSYKSLSRIPDFIMANMPIGLCFLLIPIPFFFIFRYKSIQLNT